jgi:hypothetical protein
MKPKTAQKGPYAVKLEEGHTYYWCACGLSEDQPFCDGSHSGTGLRPALFMAEKFGTQYLCGCKKTRRHIATGHIIH